MAILLLVLTLLAPGVPPTARIMRPHYRISMAKCQLNLPRRGHPNAPAPIGGNGEVPVAGAKMGGQAASAD
jgi:hypothetical protein